MKKLVQTELERLNKIWGLDFVNGDIGKCCATCAEFDEVKKQKKYENAETFLVVKYFTGGMNYRGEFEDQAEIAVIWNTPNTISITKVCEDLQKSLIGNHYEIIEPANITRCIMFKQKEVATTNA